ncbi:MAG: hypothetical protein E4H20_08385 [Spirochaetales bacterium]|nr:MAG: hypothetical protein E4H20_08385 [Spirochaetales bacterium]
MKQKIALVALLCAALASAFGAGLSVPEFGILTNGRVNDAGAFVLSTRVTIDMLIEGGAKFAAWFKLGFKSDSLEEYLAALYSEDTLPDTPVVPDDLISSIRRLESITGIGLKTAAISVSEAFGTPLDLALFVGTMDVFCSGMDYPQIFGTAPFATKLRGFLYYPDGIGDNPSLYYDGIHAVYGTGLRLSLPGESILPSFYLYQDSWLGPGQYSADARVQFNWDRVKLEAFAGVSFPVSTAGVYRGGFLFHYDTESIGSFYAQIGVPRWDPISGFDMNLLYFMFEPRFDFGPGSLILTVFHHPAWYLQGQTDEAGLLEMRADLGFGDLNDEGWQGGAETTISYDPNAVSSPLSIEASPYLQSLWSGVKVDLRLNILAFPVPEFWYGMFAPSIGLTTSF